MKNKINKDKLKPRIIVNEIKKFYNLDFLESLKNIPRIKIYVFGGFVRDILLGKQWKDLDIRVLLNKDWQTAEKIIENALRKNLKIEEKLRFKQNKFTVYRFLPPASLGKNSIDLTLASTIRQVKSDFTINDIFLDLISGEIIDGHNGLLDLKNGKLRTVINPDKQFQQEPWMLFRAVKFACQFNLDIASDTYKAMLKKAKLGQSQLAVIANKRKGLWVEVLLGNLFQGLSYNPFKYFEFFLKTGLLDELLDFLSKRLDLKINSTDKNHRNIFSKKRKLSTECNLSLFLSFLAGQLKKDNPKKYFKEIKRILALDEPKKFAEFPVDISEIKYLET